MTFVHRGHHHRNSASTLVSEFLERKRLAVLGLTTDLRSLSCFKADCFLVIDSEFETLRAEDAKRESRTKGKRTR